MSERPSGDSNIGNELKELGRQLTTAVKSFATSDEVRSLGQELRDGLRDAAHSVEETMGKVRERDEVQALRAKAADVAESFRTGDAQREIRSEVTDALRALNLRLRDLLERLQTDDTPPTPDNATPSDESYTGATRKLDS